MGIPFNVSLKTPEGSEFRAVTLRNVNSEGLVAIFREDSASSKIIIATIARRENFVIDFNVLFSLERETKIFFHR